MHIIIGGTGQVGSAAAAALLETGESVTIVTRDSDKAAAWRQRGAEAAVLDIHDAPALQAVLRHGRRLLIVNPTADPTANDTDAAELQSIRAILAAVDGAGLERIVAASTYGAQPGSSLGDLGTLYALEQGLARLPAPSVIQRGAYYMSNWAMAVEPAREQGILPSFFPAGFSLPMVAPADVGRSAAELMLSSHPESLRYVEGPDRYSPADVAEAFSRVLQHPVAVASVEADTLESTFLSFGFSPAAARSYSGMTRRAMETPPPDESSVWKGTVSLDVFVAALLQR